MKKTSQIRKQPRRSSRREMRPYFRNPLNETTQSQLVLPVELKGLVIGIKYISMRSLEGQISVPERPHKDLLDEIRNAVGQQGRKLKEIEEGILKASLERKNKMQSVQLGRKRISTETNDDSLSSLQKDGQQLCFGNEHGNPSLEEELNMSNLDSWLVGDFSRKDRNGMQDEINDNDEMNWNSIAADRPVHHFLVDQTWEEQRDREVDFFQE